MIPHPRGEFGEEGGEVGKKRAEGRQTGTNDGHVDVDGRPQLRFVELRGTTSRHVCVEDSKNAGDDDAESTVSGDTKDEVPTGRHNGEGECLQSSEEKDQQEQKSPSS